MYTLYIDAYKIEHCVRINMLNVSVCGRVCVTQGCLPPPRSSSSPCPKMLPLVSPVCNTSECVSSDSESWLELSSDSQGPICVSEQSNIGRLQDYHGNEGKGTSALPFQYNMTPSGHFPQHHHLGFKATALNMPYIFYRFNKIFCAFFIQGVQKLVCTPYSVPYIYTPSYLIFSLKHLTPVSFMIYNAFCSTFISFIYM